jgi:L-aspartate oxidase
LIATGGLAANYLHTTNPRSARGDGIAMAARAGARTAGLEYVQFHPTALAIDGADNFLISEAVRGEGAVLLSPDGREFMRAYAPEWRDLAPRDVVARAINEQMLMHGTDHVLLDLSSRMSAERILRRFPAIAECCLLHGIDITRDAIPVRPAAHYTCGGIVVDAFGRTTLAGLYAIGEASNTGLHGANRLASTSLLEGLVWGSTAADDIEAHLASTTHDGASSASSQSSDGTDEPDRALIALRHEQLRDAMWTGVGLIRTRASLERAIERLVAMHAETVASMSAWRPDAEASGLRNAIEASMLVARAAHRRRESSGCHWRADGVVAAV